MIPLVGWCTNSSFIIDEASWVLADVASKHGCTLRFPIGTMIELPRAALTAGEIAKSAAEFSFGKRPTQTTWGFSRDDVEAGFFSLYLDKGVFGVPRSRASTRRVSGRLVSIASTEGREVRPDLHLGVGEHGGDPQSVHFFHNVGLDYVSCSPFRVPVARLEAARASLGMTSSDMR